MVFNFNDTEYTITITDKERIYEGSGDSSSSKYLVFGDAANGASLVFENIDCFIRGKWNSSNLQGKMKEGNNTGLYCSECGKWQRWLGKDELRAFEHSKKNQVLVQMRDATPEENRAISEHIKSISDPTSINVLGEKSIVKRLEKFVIFLEKKIDS